MQPSAKTPYVDFAIFLRLLLFAFGIVTIFWYFFSFIGVLIGLLLFTFSRDSNWRVHGLALSLSAAISEFAAHTGTAVAPLLLGMRTGPVILSVYLILYVFCTLLLRRERKNGGITDSSRVTITGSMAAGIGAVLKLGGRIWSRARVPLTVILVAIPIGLWASVSIHPGVLFDNRPRMLWVNAPSTVEAGEPFPVTVQAWDAYERLSATYRGTASFGLESYRFDGSLRGAGSTVVDEAAGNAQLPQPYTFTGRRRGSGIAYRIRDERDNGSHRFTARIDMPGIHYLVVRDSITGNSYYSNPVEVGVPEVVAGDAAEAIDWDGDGQGGTEGRIYWGDIHSHSDLSDATGTAAQSYDFARRVAGLDFYALTDHGEIMTFSFNAFDRLEQATNSAYEPGSFVTFHGVEWTQVKTGHYTCIFSGDRLIKQPRLSYLSVSTTDDLWDALDAFTEQAGCRALALPHHTTQNSYIQDWSYINPEYVKLAEVSSVHGEFLYEQRHPLNYAGAIDPPPEYVAGSSIAAALRTGKRLVLYAAGDEHDGHPGHSLSHTPAFIGHQRPMTRWRTRIGHPYPGGLTSVYAPELTREAVFSALERGRIFACSDHGRPLLHFTINGVPVGTPSDEDGGSLPGAVHVEEPTSPRRIAIFLAQDGSPAATRDTSAAASVIAGSGSSTWESPAPKSSQPAGSGWQPDWKADIEIIKNGELLTVIPVDRPVSRVRYVDRDPVTGAAYGPEECFRQDGQTYINRYSDNPVDPQSLNTGGADFYLIRVVGRNGRSAYAGPIWVEVKKEGRTP